MRICYVPKQFRGQSLAIIQKANEILDEYAKQGLVLTLRQLYYQFVSRDILPNRVESYHRLGSIVNDARLAGLIDWDCLEDRTRNLKSLTHFYGPEDALTKLSYWYQVDMWANQRYRPEVWIEKDALVGVIDRVCQENDVPFFSCRGFTSQSEMWAAGQRFVKYLENDQVPIIFHFGDHDPSGIDMSRDIQDRIRMFIGRKRNQFEFIRVALNMDQIDQYNPPPNPAKTTDSRFRSYMDQYGDESWELDALEPSQFRDLIEQRLNDIRDDDQWQEDKEEESRVIERLRRLARNWQNE